MGTIENCRVRKLTLLYYTADDTIALLEPRETNSGLVQGDFLRRQQTFAQRGGRRVLLSDLALGKTVQIFGRSIRLVECDEATRTFFQENRKPLGEKETYPESQLKLYEQRRAKMYDSSRKITEAAAGSSTPRTLLQDLGSTPRSSFGQEPAKKPAVLRFFSFRNTGKGGAEFSTLTEDENSNKRTVEKTTGGAKQEIKPTTLLSEDTTTLSPAGALYSLRQYFTILFHTEDSTIEIMRQPTGNTYPVGKTTAEGKSLYHSRAAVPRSQLASSARCMVTRVGIAPSPGELVQAEDLQTGSSVILYGEEFHLYDCDEKTKDWYHERQLIGATPAPNGTTMNVNATTSIIEQKDCKHLYFPTGVDPETGAQVVYTNYAVPLSFCPATGEPKLACSSDFSSSGMNNNGTSSKMKTGAKMLSTSTTTSNKMKGARMAAYRNVVLRFSGKLVDDDLKRTFVVAFYLADNTVSVYEQRQENSGFTGGNFIQRIALRNVEKNRNFLPSDFFVGATVNLIAKKFFLSKADEFTLRFMEQHPRVFPKADLVGNGNLEKILTKSRVEDFETPHQLKQYCASELNLTDLSDQEVLTLVRFSGPGTDEQDATIRLGKVREARKELNIVEDKNEHLLLVA
ncbi:unnamed protein product [Amoebophrya sp. A120]|nr:unnamed protein product [Amoebophrya sp. A120]|eukprot:GSA120T00012372001.1